jgi:glycosyltransferase involved in cell wall biosynthesis
LRTGPPWDLLSTYRPALTYVAVSTARQRLLARILGCQPEAISVISNGVDAVNLLGLSSFGRQVAAAAGLLEADLVLLMPVRITRAKNIEYALAVTQALKGLGQRVRLVVSGPPDPYASEREAYFDQLRELRRTLGLEADVAFICERDWTDATQPDLTDSQVAELYRLADVVLMPSHREGFGLPVLEGGLLGKPVFSTDLPVEEMLGDTQPFRIGPGEPATELAARILTWAKRDATHHRRVLIRQTYTWPAIFSQRIEPLMTRIIRNEEEL